MAEEVLYPGRCVQEPRRSSLSSRAMCTATGAALDGAALDGPVLAEVSVAAARLRPTLSRRRKSRSQTDCGFAS